MGYKLIVAGGRDFDNYDLLKERINKLNIKNLEIVSGKAKGVDTLGERYAKENGLLIHEFPADWEAYGKSAGYRRNVEMANFSDGCICFWDMKSRGTKHMIDISIKKEIDLKVELY